MPVNPRPRSDPLTVRIARYERIIAMRGPNPEAPLMSLDDIGATFVPPLSRQRVLQIIEDGVPKRSGRPRNPARRDELRRKLGVWEQRRARHLAAGTDATTADRRIAALSAELAAFD